MSSALLDYYLSNHPKEAATLIDNAAPAAANELLQQLAPAIRANLFPNLLPSTIKAYLTSVDPSEAVKALENLRAPLIASLLQSLEYDDRGPILSRFSREIRERITHQLRYPPDSIGAILLTPTPACRNSATIREAKKLVRRLASPEASVIVSLNDDMHPVGLLDFAQLIRLRESEKVNLHMRRIPRPLRARTEMRVCAELSAWSAEDFLPAVNETNQFVGLVSKARLLKHLSDQRSNTSNAQDVADTLLNLAELMWKPAAEFLASAASTQIKKGDN